MEKQKTMHPTMGDDGNGWWSSPLPGNHAAFKKTGGDAEETIALNKLI